MSSLVTRFSTACAFLVSLILASGAALAAPITQSSFGFGGAFTTEAGTNLGNNHQINIANGGSVIISSPDLFDLAGVVNFGNLGTLLSIPDVSSFSAMNSFLVLGGGVQFDLTSLSIISRTGTMIGGSFLNLYGLGTLHAPGFDATPAGFSFTGTSSNNVVFTFAATITVPPTPIPEPWTLILLGTGVIGLAGFGLRRKTNKTATPA